MTNLRQRFVDLMKGDSRFAKGTTNNFWKRLARQNSIPQTHAGELEEASITWMRKGNPWDAAGKKAFAKAYRESLRGLPLGVRIEWVDVAEQNGIPMKHVERLQRVGDEYMRQYGWNPRLRQEFITDFKFGMETKALFESDFVSAQPLGYETKFFEKAARMNDIPQSMVPELKGNFLEWSKVNGSGPKSVKKYLAEFKRRVPIFDAPIWWVDFAERHGIDPRYARTMEQQAAQEWQRDNGWSAQSQEMFAEQFKLNLTEQSLVQDFGRHGMFERVNGNMFVAQRPIPPPPRVAPPPRPQNPDPYQPLFDRLEDPDFVYDIGHEEAEVNTGVKPGVKPDVKPGVKPEFDPFRAEPRTAFEADRFVANDFRNLDLDIPRRNIGRNWAPPELELTEVDVGGIRSGPLRDVSMLAVRGLVPGVDLVQFRAQLARANNMNGFNRWLTTSPSGKLVFEFGKMLLAGAVWLGISSLLHNTDEEAALGVAFMGVDPALGLTVFSSLLGSSILKFVGANEFMKQRSDDPKKRTQMVGYVRAGTKWVPAIIDQIAIPTRWEFMVGDRGQWRGSYDVTATTGYGLIRDKNGNLAWASKGKTGQFMIHKDEMMKTPAKTLEKFPWVNILVPDKDTMGAMVSTGLTEPVDFAEPKIKPKVKPLVELSKALHAYGIQDPFFAGKGTVQSDRYDKGYHYVTYSDQIDYPDSFKDEDRSVEMWRNVSLQSSLAWELRTTRGNLDKTVTKNDHDWKKGRWIYQRTKHFIDDLEKEFNSLSPHGKGELRDYTHQSVPVTAEALSQRIAKIGARTDLSIETRNFLQRQEQARFFLRCVQPSLSRYGQKHSTSFEHTFTDEILTKYTKALAHYGEKHPLDLIKELGTKKFYSEQIDSYKLLFGDAKGMELGYIGTGVLGTKDIPPLHSYGNVSLYHNDLTKLDPPLTLASKALNHPIKELTAPPVAQHVDKGKGTRHDDQGIKTTSSNVEVKVGTGQLKNKRSEGGGSVSISSKQPDPNDRNDPFFRNNPDFEWDDQLGVYTRPKKEIPVVLHHTDDITDRRDPFYKNNKDYGWDMFNNKWVRKTVKKDTGPLHHYDEGEERKLAVAKKRAEEARVLSADFAKKRKHYGMDWYKYRKFIRDHDGKTPDEVYQKGDWKTVQKTKPVLTKVSDLTENMQDLLQKAKDAPKQGGNFLQQIKQQGMFGMKSTGPKSVPPSPNQP